MDPKENNIEISIVLAIRNEERYLVECMDSLINQDFPKNKYEIIVVDGMSDDKTPQIVKQYQDRFPELVKSYLNPMRTQANGRKIGISHSYGEIIWMFDGHSYTNPDSLIVLLSRFSNEPNFVMGIGGRHVAPEDETFMGKVIFEVQRSILGGAGTSYRQPASDKYVKTIAFGAYRRGIIETIGGYDTRFDIGEDLEMNWRINKAGFRLLFCFKLVNFYYRKHNSLSSFMVRMIKYGFWRMMVAKKLPDSFSVLFLLPILLLLSLLAFMLLVLFSNSIANVLGIILVTYMISVLISSILIAIRMFNIRSMISLPIYLIEHFGIALGLISGIFGRFHK